MIDHPKVASRYWDKVSPEPNTGCWLWFGAANKRGYGNINTGNGAFTYCAHRYFYIKLVGEIAEGVTIDHLCKTTRCVNPDHMEVVSLAENSRRGGLGRKWTASQRRKLMKHVRNRPEGFYDQPKDSSTGRFVSRGAK